MRACVCVRARAHACICMCLYVSAHVHVGSCVHGCMDVLPFLTSPTPLCTHTTLLQEPRPSLCPPLMASLPNPHDGPLAKAAGAEKTWEGPGRWSRSQSLGDRLFICMACGCLCLFYPPPESTEEFSIYPAALEARLEACTHVRRSPI